jgi:hypothetical protein
VIQAIADGIKRAGSDDPKAIAKALEDGKPVETVMGQFVSTARATSSTRATTPTFGAPANTRPSQNERRLGASVQRCRLSI